MMEPYRVEYSQDAQDILEKMERKTTKRIMDKLDDAARNPDHFFERLQGQENCKLRVGDYRVIGLVFHVERAIFVRSMDHRKRVYKRR
jgi:mRNA interferase RelE/StbE